MPIPPPAPNRRLPISPSSMYLPALILILPLCTPPAEGRIILDDGWVHLRPIDGDDDREVCIIVTGRTRIVWCGDPRVQLPRSALRPGTRVRYVPSIRAVDRVVVVTLGPLAMEAAVESWVADAAGGRAWLALDGDELAEVARLGAPCWAVREGATRRLRARRGDALRALIWAQHSADREIRLRAAGLLAEMGWP